MNLKNNQKKALMFTTSTTLIIFLIFMSMWALPAKPRASDQSPSDVKSVKPKILDAEETFIANFPTEPEQSPSYAIKWVADNFKPIAGSLAFLIICLYVIML